MDLNKIMLETFILTKRTFNEDITRVFNTIDPGFMTKREDNELTKLDWAIEDACNSHDDLYSVIDHIIDLYSDYNDKVNVFKHNIVQVSDVCVLSIATYKE